MIKMFVFIIVLGIDVCYPACPMVRSAKHGELFLSQGERVVEKCEGLARFVQKETGKMFCLKKKGNVPEKVTCTNCECGQENKPSNVDTRVVGGENVGKHQYPWYSLIFKHNKDNTTVAGNNSIFILVLKMPQIFEKF